MSQAYRVEVHKFGGTSVGDADRIRAVAAIVRDASAATRIVVVTSAMAGVTDQLIAAGDMAVRAERDKAAQILEAMLARHLEALDRLAVADAAAVGGELRRIFGDYLPPR